jgi:hypothetical protein
MESATEGRAMDTAFDMPPATGRARSRPFLPAKNHQVHCGQAATILSEDLQAWFRHSLGCVAGRREFAADRYFAVDVHSLSDVVVGWRRFLGALERREAIACMYVIRDPAKTLSSAHVWAPLVGVRPAIKALAEIMSTLSEEAPGELVAGGSLNFVINLVCPVTACRTPFFDFDAVAFVPGAENLADPLYDPLMSAPVPLVNITSDIYAFSMFTRDQSISRFDCEITQLTRRERRYLFEESCAAWQSMAEMTIRNYAAQVDQGLCPTHLSADRRSWVANHKDPAFAELEKRAHLHEMPVQYTAKIVATWNSYFERGTPPSYGDIAAPGNHLSTNCPMGARLCVSNA